MVPWQEKESQWWRTEKRKGSDAVARKAERVVARKEEASDAVAGKDKPLVPWQDKESQRRNEKMSSLKVWMPTLAFSTELCEQ